MMNTNLKERMIQEFSALVAIPTVTEDRGACSRAMEHVLELGRSLGLQARSLRGGQIGEIEIGEGDETVAVLVHLDVVPPGIVTFGPTFPKKEDPCHEENEFMTEDCLMQIYEIYLSALQKLAGAEGKLR